MKTYMVMLMVAFAATVLQGAPIVDDGATAWSDTDELGGLSWSDQSGGSTTSSGADHSITAGDPDLTPYEDLFFQAGGNLAVDLENYLYVYGTYSETSGHTPNEVSYYINDGTYSWYYDLSGPGTTYASLADSAWYSPDGGAPADPDWLSAGAITEIGIRIWYADTAGVNQTYGISNMTLNDAVPPEIGALVPEPGSFIVLSTALMSLGFTYARRKKEAKA